MAAKKSTLPPCIYYNEKKKCYDVKNNYSVFNPVTQQTEYKQEWIRGLKTVAEAKQALADARSKKEKPEEKDITLEGAYELWKVKAAASNYSPNSLKNTKEHMNAIFKHLDKHTLIKNINEDVYYQLFTDLRAEKYSEETIHSLNATFRKVINLAYRKRLINENPLDRSDGIKTDPKIKTRLVSYDEFLKLDEYFSKKTFVRKGVDTTPLMRLLVNILYFTGMRIGEVLALTWEDFEEFSYYKKGTGPLRLVPTPLAEGEKHLQGMRVNVDKNYLTTWNTVKGTKNKKNRKIPLDYTCEYRFLKVKKDYCKDPTDRVFPWTHSNCVDAIKKACVNLEIPKLTCHDFRHTFISNLVKQNVPITVIEKVSGDTQETILKRYSHMFEQDEVMVLEAFARVKEDS